MKITSGSAEPLGAHVVEGGVNFSVWSSVATRVELCLFDARGHEQRLDLPDCSDGVWHGFVPGCGAGQRYGYRVHGEWNPAAGLRSNPAKVLLDPYARQIVGSFDWDGGVFDYARRDNGDIEQCTADNAGAVPLSVVRDDARLTIRRPAVPWTDTLLYECNVRGYTMRHPDVPEADRGRFSGMRNKDVLAYVKALGITTIELMPVLAFIDEHHLVKHDLRNYWGYNTISFFAPMQRYGASDPVTELREMITAIHDAGLEVVLDVAYNHTAEGDGFGPTVSFRGLDNLAYYRTVADDPARYVNDTGCGNTINADHPRVQALIIDSLRYLHSDIGCDGFRFDLGPILGRYDSGFSASHPLLTAMTCDEQLATAKLIAEPWDPGPGGYQLGHFPRGWAEWNDRFRDTVRRFWRGDDEQSGLLAQRIHGSSDIFEVNQRRPYASVNFITAHDGFTLSDLVSFEHRHNEANGENNRDGHDHNYSRNYGVEGETRDATVLAARRRQRINMLATLLFSQGTPMLLAGDEFGNSQGGNNNAYAQDNEIAWLDWRQLRRDPDYLKSVRRLLWLRRNTPLLRLDEYVHEPLGADVDGPALDWLNAAGEQMDSHHWSETRSFAVLMRDGDDQVMLVINGNEAAVEMRLPPEPQQWRIAFSSADVADTNRVSATLNLEALSTAILVPDYPA